MQRELVELARRGDHDAFEALASVAFDGLYALAHRILRDVDRTDDAVQECLIRAWRQLPHLRDPERFEAWLRRLLVNACYDESRRTRRRSVIGRGGWMYSEPCGTGDTDIAVGPTVDDFVDALTSHPALDLAEPVDVTLGGYAGKYLEIQGPDDLTDCPTFQVSANTFYAQGASNLWRVWVLDVDGTRVVFQTSEFPGTAPDRLEELRGITDSLRIEP